MFRTDLAADAGMLFVYPSEQQVQFWMQNTMIPLDMLFIGADGHARFGLMIVREGRWGGRHLVSERWIQAMLTPSPTRAASQRSRFRRDRHGSAMPPQRSTMGSCRR